MSHSPVQRDLLPDIIHILNGADVGIMIASADGITQWANHHYERIVQMKAADFIGKSVRFLNEQGSFRVYGSEFLIDTVLRERKPVSRIVDYHTPSDIVATGSPIFGPDQEIRWIIYVLIDIDEVSYLRQQLYQAYEETEAIRLRLQEAVEVTLEDQGIIVRDKVMKDIYSTALRIAQVDATLLILGETGTGKDIVAKYIHNSGNRKNHHFVHVNCSAIPEALFESELFGYEPGSFTGAVRQGKMGLIELAHGGTLFLDEVAELPPNMQAKLLTVLQEKVVTRVGSVKPKEVDVRVIAATNQNLEELTQEKKFREDLFYRLNVLEIRLPPLRERTEDIPVLINHFQKKYNRKYGKITHFSKEILNEFQDYCWPGNIRELNHMIERLIIMCPTENIDLSYLPKEIRRTKNGFERPLVTDEPEDQTVVSQSFLSKKNDYGSLIDGGVTLKAALEQMESEMIHEAIAQSANLHEAAKLLGIEISTLTKKKQKYRIYKRITVS